MDDQQYNQQYNQILSQVAQETLESLAFLFSFSAEERDISFDQSSLMARVFFSGPLSGLFYIVVSDSILPELVRNMLGIETEKEVPVTLQHDALKELLNIVCGNLLPALVGKQEIFTIDVPAIVDPKEFETLMQSSIIKGKAKLDLENGKADFILFVTQGIQSATAPVN